MDVHRPQFGTAVQSRHGFARIEQTIGIESGFDRMKLAEFGSLKLDAHLIDFFHAYAVFTGDGAADFDTQGQNLAPKCLGALQFAGLIGIELNPRVQVTVARVEHVSHG